MSAELLLIKKQKIVGRKRQYLLMPDPVYNSLDVSLLTNVLMKGGNKSVVYQRIVLPALSLIKSKHGEDPCDILSSAFAQARPALELRKLSATSHYQVPCEIKAHRSYSMSVRFIANAARKRSGKKMCESLYQAIWDAANGRGDAVERKENMRRSAEANTAFKSF